MHHRSHLGTGFISNPIESNNTEAVGEGMSGDGDNTLAQVKPGKPGQATAVTKSEQPDK